MAKAKSHKQHKHLHSIARDSNPILKGKLKTLNSYARRMVLDSASLSQVVDLALQNDVAISLSAADQKNLDAAVAGLEETSKTLKAFAALEHVVFAPEEVVEAPVVDDAPGVAEDAPAAAGGAGGRTRS